MNGTVRWRVLTDPPLSGVRNMALDHALAGALAPGEGVLRFYGWSRPTLSFGRNEPAAGRYDPERIARGGLDVVRRPTGGRTVLHHLEVTYCVAVGDRVLGGPRDAYRCLNEGLVAALGSMGVPAGIHDGAAGASPLTAGPCFELPAPGEVVVVGRKLVGSAQVRIGRVLLQHGSLLLSPGRTDPEAWFAAARGGEAYLEEFLDPLPSRQELVESLQAGLASRLGGEWRWDAWTDTELAGAEELLGLYGDPAWTWRR